MTIEPAPRAGRLDEIPVIDLNESDLKGAARKVRHACENSAFFYIANHGVAPEVVEGAFSAARTFFQLPLDDPDVVAGLPLHGPNQWPDTPGFRTALEAYFAGVTTAGMKLMRVLAISLDLEEDFFTKLYTKPSILSRVIHYPKPEDSHAAEFGIGALAHTDYGHITILAQDPAGGLEVRLPSGEWIAAPYVQDTFVVNLGDLTARWTNDVYRSNLHRVVNRLNRGRMSIPTFMNPNHRAVVACIPTCAGPGNPPKYEPVLAGEYVTNKIRENQGYKAPAK